MSLRPVRCLNTYDEDYERRYVKKAKQLVTTTNNNILAEKISKIQQEALKGAIDFVKQFNFYKFPLLFLALSNDKKYTSVSPRVDGFIHDDSTKVMTRFAYESRHLTESTNPSITVLFRPIINVDKTEMQSTMDRILDIEGADGIVNVHYILNAAEYVKIWNHMRDNPFEYCNFICNK